MRRFFLLCAAAAVAAPSAASLPSAAAAPATWTKITSPKGPGQPLRDFRDNAGTAPTMSVKGTASGVPSVNIYCFWDHDQQVTPYNGTPLNSSPIPVTNGAFGPVDVPYPNSEAPCVLRALPDSYGSPFLDGAGHNTGYVGSFTGPTYYAGAHQTVMYNAQPIVGFAGVVQSHGEGYGTSPEYSGVANVRPVDPDTQFIGGDLLTDAFTLHDSNLVADSGTPTRSQIVIDGHDAYTPAALTGVGATSGIPAISFTPKRHSDGNLYVHEVAPLRRCAGDPPYPISSCTPKGTGVRMVYTVVMTAQGSVLRATTRFVDVTHAAHTLTVEFGVGWPDPDVGYGRAGIRLPGQTGFHALKPGTLLKNLPVGAHTLLATADMFAGSSSGVTLEGLTYSGKPVMYVATTTAFGLRYSRGIPKNRAASFTFSIESGFTLTAVKRLAAAQQGALTPQLRITSPHNGGSTSDHTPTVSGKVTNAVNGLPSTVRVTIGTTTKKVAVSATGTWSATFALSAGGHTVHAHTTDPSGLVLSAASTFTVS